MINHMACGNLVIREQLMDIVDGWILTMPIRIIQKLSRKKASMGSVKMMEIPRNQRNQNHIYAIM